MSFQASEFVISLEIPSAPQKLLLMCIAYHVDRKTGRWAMSQEDLAEEATMSIRQVKHHTAALETDRRIIRRERRDRTGAREDYEYELVGYAQWMKGQRVAARDIHERARNELATSRNQGAETRTKDQGAETRTKDKVRKSARRNDANPHLGLTQTRTYIEVQSNLQSFNSQDEPQAARSESAAEKAPIKSTATTVEAASTVKSEVEPVTSEPRAQLDLKTQSSELQSKVKPSRRNSKEKKVSNTSKMYSERFEAFWTAYREAAGEMHGTKEEASLEWDRLSDEDQDVALAAIRPHRRKLGDIKFKHACRYLKYRQFDDYAPQVQAAPEPVVTDDDKIRAVVWDLMSDMREPDRIKRHGWLSFGVVKQVEPAIWAEAVKRARADGWRPYGELVALAA